MGGSEWASMPLEELMRDVQTETLRLVTLIDAHGLDESNYWRGFWTHWKRLPAEMSVAAANRDCEHVNQTLDEARRQARVLMDAQRAKVDAMISVLHARSA